MKPHFTCSPVHRSDSGVSLSMARKPTAPSPSRKPRLLWATPFCLLDTSSGASLSVREMLRQLVARGYDVQILGCTIFDNPKGANLLQQIWQRTPARAGQIFIARDGELEHQLLVTGNTYRESMTSEEENRWHQQYAYLLDSFRPDVVWFYGGYTLELLIADEARSRGIPSAFYLVNGNYLKGPRWSRDIDLILTDTQATADLYRAKMHLPVTPIGKFIDPERFVAKQHQRKNVLFVNPTWPKGAGVFVQLALMLEQLRPDITLEVVEARADWSAILKEASRLIGTPRDSLSNVRVTANTSDMRPVYERARILLLPSLWWESGARVLAEAMLNGIPAIVSNYGGSPGLIENAGIVIDLPAACHEEPYQHIPGQHELQPLLEAVIAFYDDQQLYEEYVERAVRVGKEQHHMEVSTNRLLRALMPLVQRKAGDRDYLLPQRKQHKYHLAGITVRPEYIVDPIVDVFEPEDPEQSFDWQLDSPVVIMDNRASLLDSGVASAMMESGAFAMIAFDPASIVHLPESLSERSDLQLIPHALLGDGKKTTLYACLDPRFSHTLVPLPKESVLVNPPAGAQIIAELSVPTIALDSIEGLSSLDWLILDGFSDSLTILENGRTALSDSLIIQACVAIQPVYQQQLELPALLEWASRHGFSLYRLNNVEDSKGTTVMMAEALLVPTTERIEKLSNAQKQKLAFLMHTLCQARDITYELLSTVKKSLAESYLQATSKSEKKLTEPKDKSSDQHESGTPKASRYDPLESVRALATPPEQLNPGERGLFLDCGGYDGCSSIKFSINNPGFDCVTFEPNPVLWPYYEGLPTTLIKKAAYTYDGKIRFTLDSVDEDGSSIISEKKIDFTGRVKNSQLPTMTVDCIDLARIIREAGRIYQRIILKLDVEGAEYDILDKIIKEGLLGCIEKIYCEFHWHKCGIPRSRHDDIVRSIGEKISIEEWDALDFSVHKRAPDLAAERNKLLRNFSGNFRPIPSIFLKENNVIDLQRNSLKETSFKKISNSHDSLYEISRKKLSGMLNDLHGMNEGERFWEIILHYFIAYKFMPFYVARWNNSMLNPVRNLAQVLRRFPCRTTMDFGILTFNLQGQSSPFFDGKISLSRYVESSNNAASECAHDFSEVIDIGRPASSRYAYNLGVQNKNYWARYFESKGIELIDAPRISPVNSESVNWDFRKKVARLDTTEPVHGFQGFWSSMAISLPKELIEDFSQAYGLAKRVLDQSSPEVVVSALLPDISSRMISAILTARGVPLYLHQHGGAYGEYPSHAGSIIEPRISDKFYSWGWTDGSEKVVPGQPYRLEDLKGYYDILEKSPEEILIIGAHSPEIPTILKGTDADYLDDKLLEDFLATIPEEDYSRITFRVRRQHGHSEAEEQRIINLLPSGSRIDFQKRSIAEAYAAAREVIILAPFTTSEWECKYLKIPYRVISKPEDIFMSVSSGIPRDYL